MVELERITALGQAVVAYEIFTGETLPRRGFFRHWRNALLLAAAYGIVMGGSLVVSLHAVYVLLLTTVQVVIIGFWHPRDKWDKYVAGDVLINNIRFE